MAGGNPDKKDARPGDVYTNEDTVRVPAQSSRPGRPRTDDDVNEIKIRHTDTMPGSREFDYGGGGRGTVTGTPNDNSLWLRGGKYYKKDAQNNLIPVE